MIEGVLSGYSVQGTEYVGQSTTGATSNQSSNSTYSVDISDTCRAVSNFFTQLGVDYSPGTAISLDDLKEALRQSEQAARDETDALLRENGISLTPPVELTTGQDGTVKVKGDHPQKEEIEQLMADNPEVSNNFRKASALSALVEAGEEHLEFSKAYAQDPYAAVAEYSHLFGRFQAESEAFSMIFGES